MAGTARHCNDTRNTELFIIFALKVTEAFFYPRSTMLMKCLQTTGNLHACEYQCGTPVLSGLASPEGVTVQESHSRRIPKLDTGVSHITCWLFRQEYFTLGYFSFSYHIPPAPLPPPPNCRSLNPLRRSCATHPFHWGEMSRQKAGSDLHRLTVPVAGTPDLRAST